MSRQNLSLAELHKKESFFLRIILFKNHSFISTFCLAVLFFGGFVNLLGVFGPEIGFDALWYHLTIPRLYLAASQIFHIPGGLLYYSELPRLAEILYIPLLKYLGDIGPHLLSWGAGIGAAVITYKLARKYLPTFYSLLSVALFYVTPLVSWQSGSGYVDLERTFFEVLALYLVISQKFSLAGIVIGLAISTKTLAVGSVPILALIAWLNTKSIRHSLFLILNSFLVALPWFLSAYFNTGYSFYPIGAGILDTTHNLNLDIWNLPRLAGDFWKLWLSPQDPISPIYLIVLPFLLVSLPRLRKLTILLTYCLAAYLGWYITPRTGGGRFILPYLPAFAILVGATVAVQKEQIKKILIGLICLVGLINLTYRGLATVKIIPYLLGKQTKTEYLCKNLDTKVTFVDCDGWFGKNIRSTDLVLIEGYHNLYYVDFPFVHRSWYHGERYNYILSP